MPLPALSFSNDAIHQLFSLEFTSSDFATIQDIVSLGEAIIPDLVKIITFGHDHHEQIFEEDEVEAYGNAIAHSLLMLGELRATSAYPTIKQFCSRDQIEITDLIGEIPQVPVFALTHCGNKHLEDLLTCFDDEKREKFERLSFGEAAMWIAKLYPENRTRVVEFFREYLRRDSHPSYEKEIQEYKEAKPHRGFFLADEDEDFGAFVCCSLADTHLAELLPEIEQFFAENKAFPGITDIESLRKDFANAPRTETFSHVPELTLSEIYTWIYNSFYQPRRYDHTHKWLDDKQPSDLIAKEDGSTTLVRKEEKVGRNDPCPRDGQKKFKKCCGAKGYTTCQML